MPRFSPGSVHLATAIFSNPKSAGFDFEASLCMGADWTEMDTASFHLNAGESKAVQFSVTMPSILGTYPVYFKVYFGGVLIGTFAATEDVVIAVPVPRVEILRPSAAGDLTGCFRYPYGAENWRCVKEEVSDEGITYVVSTGDTDLYKLPAGSGVGTINKITVYFRWKGSLDGNWVGGAIIPKIKSNGIVTSGTRLEDDTDTWRTNSQQWATNPTNGQPWKWSDIDTLQIGFWIGKKLGAKAGEGFCTQIYVEVERI